MKAMEDNQSTDRGADQRSQAWLTALLLGLGLCPAAAVIVNRTDAVAWRTGATIGLATVGLGLMGAGRVGRLPQTLASVLMLSAAIVLCATQFVAFFWSPIELTLALSTAVWAVAFGDLVIKKRPIASYLAFVATVIVLVATIAESLLDPYKLNRPFTQKRDGELFEPDEQMTNRHLPQAALRDVCIRLDGTVEYDVTYHTDADRSRRTPARPQTGPAWRFFGGSVCFGIGANDDLAIPALIQASNPTVRVFNHGVTGHGAADARILLERTLRDDPHAALCVYLFIGDHLRRVACPDSLTWMSWGASKPRFELIDDQPVHRGSAIDTLSKARSLNVNLMMRSWFYNRLNTTTPWRCTDDVLELTAALIDQMKQTCQQTPRRRFAVVLLPQHPPAPDDPKNLAQLAALLTQRGVRVLDLSTKFADHVKQTGEDPADYFYIERHYRARLVRLIAQWINPQLNRWATQPDDAPNPTAADTSQPDGA